MLRKEWIVSLAWWCLSARRIRLSVSSRKWGDLSRELWANCRPGGGKLRLLSRLEVSGNKTNLYEKRLLRPKTDHTVASNGSAFDVDGITFLVDLATRASLLVSSVRKFAGRPLGGVLTATFPSRCPHCHCHTDRMRSRPLSTAST